MSTKSGIRQAIMQKVKMYEHQIKPKIVNPLARSVILRRQQHGWDPDYVKLLPRKIILQRTTNMH